MSGSSYNYLANLFPTYDDKQSPAATSRLANALFRTKSAQLTWTTHCPNRERLRLLDINGLERLNCFGVYVIYKTGPFGICIRVGQGDIGERLLRHRHDPEVLRWKSHRGFGLLQLGAGPLYVAWAGVEPGLVDGIERHLAETLKPLVGQRFPDVPPISVNVPI